MPILSPVWWLQEARTNLSWAVARGSVTRSICLPKGPSDPSLMIAGLKL